MPNWDISRGFLYILTINVPLFKKLWDIIEGPWLQKDIKFTNVPLFKKLWDNLRGQKSLGPLKMSLEMAHKVIVPQKKIMSLSFFNSDTLIVNFCKFYSYLTGDHSGSVDFSREQLG